MTRDNVIFYCPPIGTRPATKLATLLEPMISRKSKIKLWQNFSRIRDPVISENPQIFGPEGFLINAKITN